MVYAREGHVQAEFKVRADHLNVSGSLHSGFIASIMDNFSIYTILKDDQLPGATVDLNIK